MRSVSERQAVFEGADLQNPLDGSGSAQQPQPVESVREHACAARSSCTPELSLKVRLEQARVGALRALQFAIDLRDGREVKLAGEQDAVRIAVALGDHPELARPRASLRLFWLRASENVYGHAPTLVVRGVQAFSPQATGGSDPSGGRARGSGSPTDNAGSADRSSTDGAAARVDRAALDAADPLTSAQRAAAQDTQPNPRWSLTVKLSDVDSRCGRQPGPMVHREG